MDEEKTCKCEEVKSEEAKWGKCENLKMELPEVELFGDMPDDVISIPLAEYRHLIRCEAAVELIIKLLKTHGKYDSTRTEIIETACAICQEDLGDDADVE